MSAADGTAVPDYSRDIRLDGRGFVVLGGGEGMGRQACHALAQAGARVLCVDREMARAETVAGEIGGIPCGADVTKRADMVRIFQVAEEKFGTDLAGIVDIVGVAEIGSLSDMEDDVWNRQFDIVLKHAYLALQIGGAALANRGGGSIAFVGSLSGIASVANQVAYGTAKAALHHLVRCSAHELGPSGVRVNAVAPGFVRTPRLLQRLGEPFWKRVGETNPMRRAGMPADIARAILFLSSDLAGYVTGNVLTLDGGAGHIAALPEIRSDR